MKSLPQVMGAFETAALNAGLARNTRKSYAPTISEFTIMLMHDMGHSSLTTTEIYLHTAGLKSVASPLDTEAARNVIQMRVPT